MRQKIESYKLWGAVKKYAEENNTSYAKALAKLLPAYTARFWPIDPPRRYPDNLIEEAKVYEKKYG